ncbi:hypothetical protein [Burkholderia ambifaria]|uniref:hypothetical protein n=1 Tax=Burkholderia ambifaria TaxID=152480 RepID=UPI000F7FE11E|nr:hypothetical protein [Burkholderia ambifaria]
MSCDEILLDLDGVFADFYGRAAELLGQPYKGLPPAEAWAVLEQVPHLFRDLAPLAEGLILWQAVQSCPVRKRVLTALPMPTGHLVTAGADKRLWVARQLSATLPVTTTECGLAKAAHAHPRRVLIDDLERNINAWRAAGGIGILHTDAESTIRALADLHLL